VGVAAVLRGAREVVLPAAVAAVAVVLGLVIVYSIRKWDGAGRWECSWEGLVW
jgi:hypothetical protein